MKSWVGPGCASATARVLERIRPRRVLLVTGSDSYFRSGAHARMQGLLGGLICLRYHDFSRNPRFDELEEGVACLRAFRPDLVVAVGGGSVLDMGKAINLLAAQRADCNAIVTGREPVLTRGQPLLALPTTAGSGSEATHFVALYGPDRKVSFAHEFLRPDFAIVDAQLSAAMPPRLAASSGFDALSQAVESYWAVGATRRSQALAAAAIRRILGAFRSAVNDDDAAARATMAQAAFLAGRAIDVSRTTAAHAASYPLTIRHGVMHGHAVALTLGAFARLNGAGGPLNEPRGSGYLAQTLTSLCALFDCADTDQLSDRLSTLMSDVGLQVRLGDLGVGPADIERIVAEVNVERLDNNPVVITRQALHNVLEGLL